MALTSQAQTDTILVWNKWCARADSPVLFPTGNNMILIYSRGYEVKDLVVKSLDNALKIAKPEYKGDTACYMAMPYPKYGKRMRLTISQKGGKKPLRTVNFIAEDAPVPVATVGNLSGDHIPKRQLVAQTSMKVGFKNSLYSYPYRIKQYTFKTRLGGKDITVPVKGNLISNEISNYIGLAPEGTFIEFTDIKAACFECEPRVLENIRVWVK